ncbi:MAG: hypothetical protein QXJ64_06295 [Thermosphaera sp.]
MEMKSRSKVGKKRRFVYVPDPSLKQTILLKIDSLLEEIVEKHDKSLYDTVFLLKRLYGEDYFRKLLDSVVQRNLYTFQKLLGGKEVDKVYVDRIVNDVKQLFREYVADVVRNKLSRAELSDYRRFILEKSLSSPEKFGLFLLDLYYGDMSVMDLLSGFTKKLFPSNIDLDIGSRIGLLNRINYVLKYRDVKIRDLLDKYYLSNLLSLETDRDLEKTLEYLSRIAILDKTGYFAGFADNVVEPLIATHDVPEVLVEQIIQGVLLNIHDGFYELNSYVGRLHRLATGNLYEKDLLFIVKPMGRVVYLDKSRLRERIGDIEFEYEPVYSMLGIRVTASREGERLGEAMYNLLFPTQHRLYDKNTDHILFDLLLFPTLDSRGEIYGIVSKLAENNIYVLPVHRRMIVIRDLNARVMPDRETYNLLFNGEKIREIIVQGSGTDDLRNIYLDVFNRVLDNINSRYRVVFDSNTVSVKCDQVMKCYLYDRVNNRTILFEQLSPTDIDKMLLNEFLLSDKHGDVKEYLTRKYGAQIEKLKKVVEAFREEQEMLVNARLMNFEIINHSVVLRSGESIYIVADDPINFIKALHGDRVKAIKLYKAEALGVIETVKATGSGGDSDILRGNVEYVYIRLADLSPQTISQFIQRLEQLYEQKRGTIFSFDAYALVLKTQGGSRVKEKILTNTSFDLCIDLITKGFEIDKAEVKREDGRSLIESKELAVGVVLDTGEEKFYHIFVFKDGFSVIFEIND